MIFKTLTGAIALCATAAIAQAGTITSPVHVGDGPVATGSLDIEERLTGDGGVYNVANNTSGTLFAFGVSNTFTLATILNDDGLAAGFGCAGANGCYSAFTVNQLAWNSPAFFAVIDEVSPTFQELFGDFETASGGEDVFNWYVAEDGGLNAGASQDNFFAFDGLQLASSIIGIVRNDQGGLTGFRAGTAVDPSAVPLPAAGLLLIAGLGGLGVASRRKKA